MNHDTWDAIRNAAARLVRRSGRARPALAFSGSMMESLEARKLLATFIVDNIFTDDESDGNFTANDLTLREAVEQANLTPGTDTILFSPLLNGSTLDLTLGELSITESLIVRGYSQFDVALGITLHGGNAQRLFNVAPGVSLSIDNLTVTGGSHATKGGAIYSQGALSLTNSAITSSTSARGGGVFVESTGSFTASNSSFVSNAATTTGGGGLTVLGNYSITSSTFSANTAVGAGGGIEASADGNVVGVTFSANASGGAGGGLATTSGNVAITNSTFTLNRSDSDSSGAETGGGLSVSGGSVMLISTLISGNYRGPGVTTANDIGGTVSGTFNLIGNAATSGGLTHGVGNNIVGSAPLLGALGSYGGRVQTHTLLEGSPAINAGANPNALSNDARGGRYQRVYGSSADIGAYEYQAFELVVAHLTDESDGDTSDPDLSLREAVAIANTNPVADSITFDESLSGTLTLNGTEITISDTVTITGPGMDDLTIDANDVSRVFRIDKPSGTLSEPVFIEGLTLTGGNGGGGVGGAILSSEPLTVFRVRLIDNSSSLGGGLYTSAQLIVADSIFTNNTAAVAGGGLTFEPFFFATDQIIIARSTFTSNTASGGGGAAIFGDNSSATIFESTFSNNSSSLSGGGIAFYNGGHNSITDSTIADNTITDPNQDGGGIVIATPSTNTITRSTISGNTGADRGGGIFINAATLNLINSTVSGNNALSKGGGLYLEDATASIRNSTIAFNAADTNNSIAGEKGGGIFNDGADTTLISTIVASNTINSGTADNIRGDALNTAASTHNLVPTLSSAGGLTNGANNNVIGQPANLAPLATDLGSVATHALLAGSAAISNGLNPDDLDADQTGYSRVKGNAIDIGAREANLAPTVNVVVPSGSVGGGAVIQLAATPVDEDGSIAAVRWYYDANNDGIADVAELIATDTDGSDGWQTNYTVPLTVDPAIGLIVLAVATDDDNNVSPVAAAPALQVNSLPVFDPLETSESQINRGSRVTIVLRNVSDPDGTIRDVKFYFDTNKDGIPDSSERIATDTTASDGSYGTSYRIPLSTPSGEFDFLAVVTDNKGATITTDPVTVMVLNISPIVTTLTPGSASFAQGDFVTLTASGATDADGDGVISEIRFFYDADNDGVADEGELIAVDTNGANGWVVVLTREQTNALPLGSARFLAVAIDSEGGVSNPASGGATVRFSLLAGPNATVQGSAAAADLLRALTINQAGDPVVFEETVDGEWLAIQFRLALGAPAALDDAITWTDPKDGQTYAAYPSTDGLILLERDEEGVWSFRNLTDEILGAIAPVRELTRFTSAAGTGQVVFIAGIDADGRLVGYQQLRPEQDQDGVDISPEDWAYTFVDISGSLDEGGFDTPAYTELISYRTAWDAWHLAGLDSEGDIISVWTAPASFTAWRADNLSQINGSAPLVGGLTAILTSWRGINLTGINEQGQVVVTWWIPAFAGQWENANLTAAFNGPAIAGDGLTGYYTSWDGMNYAGLDENNQIVIYWWVPAFGGEWVVSTITDIADFTIPRPSGQLTSLASAGGTLNILGASTNGDVVRASWKPGQGGDWLLENLSEDAQRQ